MSKSALDTPMMKQFLAIKAEHPDAIVFYRMGDFYEMFMDDAEVAAPLLDIALTTRDKGKADAVPMCGVPVHSADQYIRQLAGLGHRVAVCEQVEDPKQAGGRRLVRREVVEVVTPGLVGDPEGLDGRVEVALAALDVGADQVGIAALDASTGDFRSTTIAADGHAGLPLAVWTELERIGPRELLVTAAVREAIGRAAAERIPETVLAEVAEPAFEPGGVEAPPEGFESTGGEAGMRAAAAIIGYVGEHQPAFRNAIPRLRPYTLGATVVLDTATRTHLELFENNEDRGRTGTLIAQLDATRTALGARRLARWVAYPLNAVPDVLARQESVAWLHDHDRVRDALRDALAEVRDLERLLAKAIRPGAVPRDLGLLRTSLAALPRVGAALAGPGADPIEEAVAPAPPSGLEAPAPLPELSSLLEEALIDDPPVIAKGSRGANETGYIRAGFRSELDAIREGATKGREWIAGLEATERERSGITNLKVRYHPVHGYSLEVSKAQLDKVPEDYERKQTLANVERFTTPELRDVESTVMGANERAAALEREIFESLRQAVVAVAERVRAAADRVADLDALQSLATCARREGWTRPEVDAGFVIDVKDGRHPVVEAMLRSAHGDGFVANDAHLDCDGQQILLLTGPNMSGKSTYLRQVALIVLMAQIGSYVPASAARVGVVDRIFTRVGASDRLARGESTFMVEMRETADILRQASRRSLIILDEIGRGTSTFDGLSIAWSVAEHLHDTKGLEARTLFATHYHELVELAESRPRLANYHFQVREWKDEVVFLRRLVPGGANRSYGIQVAQLAGLPESVTKRAREILSELEAGGASASGAVHGRVHASPGDGQLTLALGGESAGPSAEEREALEALRALDPNTTTPMDALLLLERLHARLGEKGDA